MDAVRFRFEPAVSLADAEMTLHLAMFATEGLFGRARVRLDTQYQIDLDDRSIAVDSSTEVGAMVARAFTGLLLREYDEAQFVVAHNGRSSAPAVAAA